MRPLDKGATPTEDGGNNIAVTEYQNWRSYLVDRIGDYCAYCNQPLSHSLQVEHVIPRNPPQGYIAGDPLAWENMLLACGPCNNAKGNNPVGADNYYLPEAHNSHLPFEVRQVTQDHAQVIVRDGLTPEQTAKAERTVRLLALDNIDNRDAVVDIRSRRRSDAMLAARAARDLFDQARHSPTFDLARAANSVALQAKAIGFFSIWYVAFLDVPAAMERLTDNALIRGTAQNCFDSTQDYRPVPRNPATDDPI